jgi:hypothetical protein
MKKITIVTLAIFVMVVVLASAANVVRWDETPLEQSAAAIPLGLGFLLELPFFLAAAALTGNGSDNGLISYDWHRTMTQSVPFLAGAFYGGLFYLVASRVRKIIAK